MTNQTAKDIFNAIYDALDRNSFRDDIGTFLISSQRRNELYLDSELGFKELYFRAQDSFESKKSLRILVGAVKEYFNKASNLPSRYFNEVNKFSQIENYEKQILLLQDEINSAPLNINDALNPKELNTFLKMVNIVTIGLAEDQDDDIIINSLLDM